MTGGDSFPENLLGSSVRPPLNYLISDQKVDFVNIQKTEENIEINLSNRKENW